MGYSEQHTVVCLANDDDMQAFMKVRLLYIHLAVCCWCQLRVHMCRTNGR
jgi:hypothetical protein